MITQWAKELQFDVETLFTDRDGWYFGLAYFADECPNLSLNYMEGVVILLEELGKESDFYVKVNPARASSISSVQEGTDGT